VTDKKTLAQRCFHGLRRAVDRVRLQREHRLRVGRWLSRPGDKPCAWWGRGSRSARVAAGEWMEVPARSRPCADTPGCHRRGARHCRSGEGALKAPLDDRDSIDGTRRGSRDAPASDGATAAGVIAAFSAWQNYDDLGMVGGRVWRGAGVDGAGDKQRRSGRCDQALLLVPWAA